MNLQHIYNLCMQLQFISSTKEKQHFLLDNRCEDFDFFLKWLLNPQIITGLDKKKLKKKVPTVRGFLATLKNCLEYLKENNTGKDVDIAYCQGFIEVNSEYKDFLVEVFSKTLKLGVNTKLVNKTYGKDFIPVHEIQQGSGRDKLHLKENESFNLTLKLNGFRATYVDGKLISRQGFEYKGFDHIIEQIRKINGSNNFVLDGELIRRNINNLPDNENFRETASIINSDVVPKLGIDFVLFDILPLEEFNKGESKETYFNRRDLLEQYVKMSYFLFNENSYLNIAQEFYRGTDQSMIEYYLGIVDELGLEGLMLSKDKPYLCKRNSNLIKIKTFKHSDLKIIDVVEGDGKYKGVLGAIVVDFRGNAVHVGSGFTDEQRKEYWEERDSLIGKIAEIKYKEVSKNKDTGLESLQFPVFCQLRPDKTKPSYE